MTRDEQGYNGWRNYATWRVNLEIVDDLCQSLAADNQAFASVADLADYLRDETDEMLTGYGEIADGLTLDYARAFVGQVDWDEIARHWTDDLVRETDDDDDA